MPLGACGGVRMAVHRVSAQGLSNASWALVFLVFASLLCNARAVEAHMRIHYLARLSADAYPSSAGVPFAWVS